MSKRSKRSKTVKNGQKFSKIVKTVKNGKKKQERKKSKTVNKRSTNGQNVRKLYQMWIYEWVGREATKKQASTWYSHRLPTLTGCLDMMFSYIVNFLKNKYDF